MPLITSELAGKGIRRIGGWIKRRRNRRKARRAARRANVAQARASGVDPFSLKNGNIPTATFAGAGGIPKIPGLGNVLKGLGRGIRNPAVGSPAGQAAGRLGRKPSTWAALLAGGVGGAYGAKWASSARSRNGQSNGMNYDPDVLKALENDDPGSVMTMLMTQSMQKRGGRGRKMHLPIYGLYVEPIQYQGSDGSMMFKSPAGYRLVHTPAGPISVYGEFAKQMRLVPRGKQKAVLSRAEYNQIKRLDTKKKRITKLARDMGCMPAPRRRAAAKK